MMRLFTSRTSPAKNVLIRPDFRVTQWLMVPSLRGLFSRAVAAHDRVAPWHLSPYTGRRIG